jgi:hypothetical protein
MMQVIGEGAYYMPSNGAPISGREAIRGFLKPHPWDKITQTPAEIEGHDGLAFVRGSYTVLYQGQNLTGYYIEIWQKQPDGAWQITRKLSNSDLFRNASIAASIQGTHHLGKSMSRFHRVTVTVRFSYVKSAPSVATARRT